MLRLLKIRRRRKRGKLKSGTWRCARGGGRISPGNMSRCSPAACASTRPLRSWHPTSRQAWNVWVLVQSFQSRQEFMIFYAT
ncbi:unnamed protein product [Symbiodinium pilosum]|uniref:Uncharacterized protein n=1 Tax=Symbiodinium pilosum TaxID=2952 RepID=A0A812IXQ5_SYMPI|nr:unnamed protein product [Symbiodinium pilosum]